MKCIAFFVLGVVSFGAVAQQVQTGLQLDSLMLKLQVAIALQKDIELQEIKGVYKLTPWHFLPNLNYDFINDKYYVTISSGPFISNLIGKRQEKRRLSAVERRYTNLEKTSEIKLKALYLQVFQKIANMNLSYQIVLNDVEVFKIKYEQHEANEIDTETFLKERSSILNKIKSHNTEIADLQKYLLDIEQLTEYELQLDVSQFFVSPLLIERSRNDHSHNPVIERSRNDQNKGGLLP